MTSFETVSDYLKEELKGYCERCQFPKAVGLYNQYNELQNKANATDFDKLEDKDKLLWLKMAHKSSKRKPVVKGIAC